ncbi:MAG: hypothetical protein ACC707_01300 [Thiohalomonadales bacterium]
MKKIIISAISFVAAFFAVPYGMDYYREYSAVASANAEIEAIREEVRINNPDEPEVLAVQQAAIVKVGENINSKGSKKERIQTAASSFMGYYLVNYRQRAEYCQEQGVDITPFINAFKEAHKREYAVAVKAISAKPSDLDKLFNILKPQLAKVIEQDMEFIASKNGVSLAGACQLISDNAAVLVTEVHISVMQPVVYNTLMSDL